MKINRPQAHHVLFATTCAAIGGLAGATAIFPVPTQQSVDTDQNISHQILAFTKDIEALKKPNGETVIIKRLPKDIEGSVQTCWGNDFYFQRSSDSIGVWYETKQKTTTITPELIDCYKKSAENLGRPLAERITDPPLSRVWKVAGGACVGAVSGILFIILSGMQARSRASQPGSEPS